MPFYFDSYYLILILPALLLTLWAQSKVNGTYNRYKTSKAAAALPERRPPAVYWTTTVCAMYGWKRIRGNLTDNYDPRSRVVHLSEGVYAAIPSPPSASLPTSAATRCSMPPPTLR